MRNDIRMWQEDAHYDLDCAHDMLAHGRFNYAVWLARQAVEKMLKAAFVQVTGEPVPMEHNLLTLARTVCEELPDDVLASLSFLNPHYTVARYVDAAVGKPSDLYDLPFAQEAWDKAERLLIWIEKNCLITLEGSSPGSGPKKGTSSVPGPEERSS
ncbi:MAG TPA: HEPN domain-containing protein [Anaerolineae bacterium]|nr:HEPN domain-containing protein [Anaerolineae bacterium]